MTDLEFLPIEPSRLDPKVVQRRRLAAEILTTDRGVVESAKVEPMMRPGQGPRGLPVTDWQGAGVVDLAPKLRSFPKPPPGKEGGWLDRDPLPKVDVVVMTWTSAEWDALHYVFTNALEPLPQNPAQNDQWREKWYSYRRDFYTIYHPLWMRRLVSSSRNAPAGAPALQYRRWGSFALASVGDKSVLLFKSDLHINQDGESLPLIQLTRQILDDCEPELLLSIGTAGGVRLEDVLGDVVVTNAAKFKLDDEFKSATFNHTSYTCQSWTPPDRYVDVATSLLTKVTEFDVEPPTAHFADGAAIPARSRPPAIHLLPGIPILTTDSFEYGTTKNELWKEGCCVEMDDAVIAMVCEQYRPSVRYGFLRNVSDPVINASLPPYLQTAWAVVTYQLQGLYTSYNSAIATWAMIAGY
jgi:nucleoside phosphorylase